MTNLKPSKNWHTANVLAEYRFWMEKWVIPASSIPAKIDHPAPSHHKQRLLCKCNQCGENFTAARATNYCSNRCRQKAHRIRNGRAANTSQAAQRAVLTKSQIRVTHTCKQCGDDFQAMGFNGIGIKYCSPKCKQATYRARKAAERAAQAEQTAQAARTRTWTCSE